MEVPSGWNMGWFAGETAKSLGLNLPSDAVQRYQTSFESRISEFVGVNMSRDPQRQADFWRSLAENWIDELALSRSIVDPLLERADKLGFEIPSILFNLYEDVIPCLDVLEARGLRLAVISNWDYSLRRVLGLFGIADRFVTITASLEEGIEKPDPALFRITLERAGFSAAETVHVGDHLEDDYVGARNAGIVPIMIDRRKAVSDRESICSLRDLPEALDWIA